MESVYSIAAVVTLLLSFFCLLLTIGNLNRVTETKGFRIIKKARERPVHFAFSVVSFMIFVSVIGTYGFPFQEDLIFVIRTIFFGTHLLIGSAVVLWVSTHIEDIYERLYQKELEKKVAEVEALSRR